MTQARQSFRLNSRSERLLRFLGRRTNLRIDLVRRLATGQASTMENLTAQEQVALVALWCTIWPIDEVIQRATTTDLVGSTGELKSQFFDELELAVEALDREALEGPAADLLKVGELLAQMYRQRDIADRLRSRGAAATENRIRDLPFLKQRGR